MEFPPARRRCMDERRPTPAVAMVQRRLPLRWQLTTHNIWERQTEHVDMAKGNSSRVAMSQRGVLVTR